MSEFNLNALNVAPGQPIYRQLFHFLKAAIEDGKLMPGDLLPAEAEFQAVLGVSRNTVRKCFDLLETEGRVLRVRGRGTYVATPKLRRCLDNLYSFTVEMRMMGLDSSSLLLEFEIKTPTPEQCGIFSIDESQKLYKIKRLRLANGEPLMVETAYIPTKMCPRLTRELLEGDSLYALIVEHTGLMPAKAIESYEAIVLRDKTARQLGLAAGSPAFRIVRTSQNSAGQVFEVCTLIVRGDKNRYEITLKRDNITFARRITDSET